MESRYKEKSSREDSAGVDLSDVIDYIKSIASYNARAPLDTEHQLLLFLQSWWSKTYNRPLKDPILLSYTLEELLYEFFDRIEREKAYKERIEQESDKIEEQKEKEALDWAEQEEKKELEAMKAAAAGKDGDGPSVDPTKDPANIAWMEKQIEEAKAIYGETFGEDIEESFDE